MNKIFGCKLGFLFLIACFTQTINAQVNVVDIGTDVAVATVIVTDAPYNADLTGTTDSWDAFDRALKYVRNNGGGVVYAPAGKYKITKPLLVGEKTTLMGNWTNPDNGGLGKGTILMAYPGKNNENSGAFIQLMDHKNCGIANISIWYPEQDASQMYPYPWTIELKKTNSAENITLYNSYKGIYMPTAEATLVNHIYGCVFTKGISSSISAEFMWYANLHFSSSYWENAPANVITNTPDASQVTNLKNYLESNFIAAQFGSMDGITLYNVTAEESYRGLLIKKDDSHIAATDAGRANDIFGFGGGIAKIQGEIEHDDWDPWYYRMPYFNLDNVPQVKNEAYDEPVLHQAAKITANFALNVKNFGAIGDGVADDSQAFKDALQQAKTNNGGIVYIPNGQYKITQALVVPTGVELRGSLGKFVMRLHPTIVACQLLCYAGANTANSNTDPAFITLEQGAGVRGFNIRYPDQLENTTEFIPYPYCIRGKGADVWVKEMLISNSYKMIDFTTNRCDNFLISRLNGYAFYDGINIGGNSDNGRMEFITQTFGVATFQWFPSWITDHSKAHNVQYIIGSCTNLQTFGITGFHPNRHIDFPNVGQGCRDADFWMTLLDVGNVSLRYQGGNNINFYGLFVTGGRRGTDDWAEAEASFTGNTTIYAPTWEHSYMPKPLSDVFTNGTITIIPEQSLTTNKTATATTSLGGTTPDMAVDNDATTYWEGSTNEELTIDLGSAKAIYRYDLLLGSLFDFQPSDNIQEVELYGSLDGTNYTKLTAPTPNLSIPVFKNANDRCLLSAPLNTVTIRYVKLKIIEAGGQVSAPKAMVREFNVFAANKSATSTMAIDENSDLNKQLVDLVLFPNPVLNDQLTIKCVSECDIKEISVYSSNGQRVYQNKFTNQSKETITIRLDPGVYIITISTEKGERTSRFVKL